MPVFMAGNVFLKGAKPCEQETDRCRNRRLTRRSGLIEKADGIYLEGNFDAAWAENATASL